MEGGALKENNKYAWVLAVDKVLLLHPIYAAAVGIANLGKLHRALPLTKLLNCYQYLVFSVKLSGKKVHRN